MTANWKGWLASPVILALREVRGALGLFRAEEAFQPGRMGGSSPPGIDERESCCRSYHA
jgi:hypothetical protein